MQLLQASPRLWDLFTRKEEYGSACWTVTDVSPPGRGREEIGRPVVSEFLVEHGFTAEYPEGRDFALCLTHDVDEVLPTRSHSIQSLIAAVTRFPSFLQGVGTAPAFPGSPVTTGISLRSWTWRKSTVGTSSFYFMATERDPFRFRYHIEDLAADLGEIRDRGWEVGVHGGYYSFTDEGAIREEKTRLEAALHGDVHGYRNHFLRIRVPETWACLEKAGFLYDTTLGYPDTPGLGTGCAIRSSPWISGPAGRWNSSRSPSA